VVYFQKVAVHHMLTYAKSAQMASGLSCAGKSMGRYTGRMVPTSHPANRAANDGTSALLR
jgi:hypothetical protein